MVLVTVDQTQSRCLPPPLLPSPPGPLLGDSAVSTRAPAAPIHRPAGRRGPRVPPNSFHPWRSVPSLGLTRVSPWKPERLSLLPPPRLLRFLVIPASECSLFRWPLAQDPLPQDPLQHLGLVPSSTERGFGFCFFYFFTAV